MIEGVFKEYGDFEDVLTVYKDTYVNEFKIDEDEINLLLEYKYIFIVVYENKIPVGAGRLNVYDGKIDFVSVIKNKRNMNYGDLIVRMLVDKAFRMGNVNIEAAVFENEVMFYKKIGFKTTEDLLAYKQYKMIKMSMGENGLKSNCCH